MSSPAEIIAQALLGQHVWTNADAGYTLTGWDASNEAVGQVAIEALHEAGYAVARPRCRVCGQGPCGHDPDDDGEDMGG